MLVQFKTLFVLAIISLPFIAHAQESKPKTLFELDIDTPPESISFSNDGSMLVVGSANTNGGIEEPAVIQETIETKNSIVIQEKENRVNNAAGNLRVYRVSDRYKLRHQYSEAQWVWDARFSPDNKTLLSGSDEGLRSRVFDDKGVMERFKSKNPGISEVNSIAFSKDGKLLAASRLSCVDIWDFQKRQLLRTIATGGESAVCFLSDSRYLVSAEGHNRVKIWNVESGQLLGEQHAEMGPLDDVDVSSDDKYVVVASELSIKLFKLDRHGDQYKFTEQYAKPGGACVDISPDDQFVATGYPRGNANIYHLETGKPFVPLESGGPRGYVTAACFAPDGKSIAFGGKTARGPEGQAFLKVIGLPVKK